jgi:hypothetical protein
MPVKWTDRTSLRDAIRLKRCKVTVEKGEKMRLKRSVSIWLLVHRETEDHRESR